MADRCICRDTRWVNAACPVHGIPSAADEPDTEQEQIDNLMGDTE